jgi:hypothetical protein
MSKLDAMKRDKLPASSFAEPSKRKYPLTDRKHDIEAKGRAKQQENSGALSEHAYDSIVSKANRRLGR